MTPPHTVTTLDYRQALATDLEAEIALTVERPAIGHGLCLWFDRETASGIGFSNAPGEADTVYGRLVLPWPQAGNAFHTSHKSPRMARSANGSPNPRLLATNGKPADGHESQPGGAQPSLSAVLPWASSRRWRISCAQWSMAFFV